MRHPSSRRLSKDGIVVLQGDLEASCTQSFVGTHYEDQVGEVRMVSSFSGFIDPTPRRSKDLHVNPEANQIQGNGSMTERFDMYKMLLRRQLLVLEGGFKPRQFSAQNYRKMKTKSICTKYQMCMTTSSKLRRIAASRYSCCGPA